MENSFLFYKSKILAALFASAGAASVFGSCCIISLPESSRISLSVFLASLFAFAARHHAFMQGPNAVKGVSFTPDGQINVLSNHGLFQADVLNFYAAPWLSVFVAKSIHGKKFNIILSADSLSYESHRHLRIQLLSLIFPPPKKPLWIRLMRDFKKRLRAYAWKKRYNLIYEKRNQNQKNH